MDGPCFYQKVDKTIIRPFQKDHSTSPTFKIYHLRVDEPQNNEEIMEKGREEGLPLGNKTILVVEDKQEVQKATGRIIRCPNKKALTF